MSGSSDPYRAIFERLVEKTRQKAAAKGKTIEKRPKKVKVIDSLTTFTEEAKKLCVKKRRLN